MSHILFHYVKRPDQPILAWLQGRFRVWGLVLLGLLGWVVSMQAQVKEPKYYIRGEEVVFEFDIRSYEKGIQDESSLFQDFKEVDLPALVAKGVLENWSYDGWSFRKVNNYVYRFVKRVDAFADEFSPNLKFLIDGRHWSKPFSEPLDPQGYDTDQILQIAENGNVTFRLGGAKRAKRVVLSGSFNYWDEQKLNMNRTPNGWELSLQLAPGIYEYKFIVDGRWITDPTNDKKVINTFDTYNSILLVGKKVHFLLPDFPRAKKVVLSGSFNNWDHNAIPFSRQEDGWLCTVDLPPGKHYYKFIVDGNWITDPTNYLTQRDNQGNLNSVVIVR